MDEKTKFIDFSAKIKSEDEEKRVITAIGSSSNIDRDNEIVNVKGMDLKAYKANPVLLWAHQHNSPPIGRATKVTKTKNGELKFDLEFADADVYPFADSIYKLYKAGFLNSFSVGFVPDYKAIEYDDKSGVCTIGKSELLELSCVPVPANADSRVITRSIIGKAVEAKVIDSDEAKDLEITLKEFGIDIEDPIEDEEDTKNAEQIIKVEDTPIIKSTIPAIEVLTKKIESLETRIKELEGLNIEKEIDPTDDYFEELFKLSSDDKSIEETDEQLASNILSGKFKYDEEK